MEYELDRIHSCKRTDIFECDVKIFFRRVGERIVATLDRQQFYALNTLVAITPKNLSEHRLAYVLGIFNSSLMNFYYQVYLKSTKRTFSEIQARQIGQIPLRIIEFSKSSEATMHEQIVTLVESMLELHKSLAETHSPIEKQMLQRQIKTTDDQINSLVYKLYGLTEEEIRIVEES